MLHYAAWSGFFKLQLYLLFASQNRAADHMAVDAMAGKRVVSSTLVLSQHLFLQKGSIYQQVHKQMVTAVQLYSNAQALQWALDIASALEYLHRQNPAIIHRDVKLSNMLCVCSERGQVVAKLSDFGLHRVSVT